MCAVKCVRRHFCSFWLNKPKVYLRRKEISMVWGWRAVKAAVIVWDWSYEEHNWEKPCKESHKSPDNIPRKIWKTALVSKQMLQLVMVSLVQLIIGWPLRLTTQHREGEEILGAGGTSWAGVKWTHVGPCSQTCSLGEEHTSELEGWCLAESSFLKIMFPAGWNCISSWCSFWTFYLFFHVS